MDAAAAIVARRIVMSGVRTITTVKIIVAVSLAIVTTPLFLLPKSIASIGGMRSVLCEQCRFQCK
jgi:hypothetical protein